VQFLTDFEDPVDQNGLLSEPEAAALLMQTAHQTHFNLCNITKHICVRTVSVEKKKEKRKRKKRLLPAKLKVA
jgi:triphosphoribosyl-dephospho-CoA synthetase